MNDLDDIRSALRARAEQAGHGPADRLSSVHRRHRVRRRQQFAAVALGTAAAVAAAVAVPAVLLDREPAAPNWGGTGTPTPAPTSAAPDNADTTTPAPDATTAPAIAGEVSEVDWANVTVPSLCGEPGPATFVDGQSALGDGFTMQFADVQYGDVLHHDDPALVADPEFAVVTYGCEGPTSWPSTTLLYGDGPDGPLFLGFLAPYYENVDVEFGGEGKLLTVTADDHSPAADNASPDLRATLAYDVIDGVARLNFRNEEPLEGAGDVTSCGADRLHAHSSYDTNVLRLNELGGTEPQLPESPAPLPLAEQPTELQVLERVLYAQKFEAGIWGEQCNPPG